jgi:hypothetical protein
VRQKQFRLTLYSVFKINLDLSSSRSLQLNLGYPLPRSAKIALEIDAKLYEELVSLAKETGQSQRFVLERALERYLNNVVPSRRMGKPEVMAAYRRSNEKYRELYKKLAK